ncbi:deoxyribodipyrimidine photo-lyase [Alkalicoccus urumqiensis]|uniref:Deoxyribodipyrimidine photo-lyase n=2 Tax=Alkalicoccus urumqiensis TaxID=1548213 RepID=A0A2P6ME31_ALKUR|nr:deoxyribodipyrimidine photo-lyase [Alkalicoccus urumqiensis]
MVNIVWLKRDLRLTDHRPLVEACRNGGPVLLLYVLEPSVWQAGDLSRRHLDFVRESIEAMQEKLRERGTPLYAISGEMIETVLPALYDTYGAFTLYAHEEHGTPDTYKRDEAVRRWIKERGLSFYEYAPFGVRRGTSGREQFAAQWKQAMERPLYDAPDHLPPPETVPPGFSKNVQHVLQLETVPGESIRYGQEGGEGPAADSLLSFLEERHVHYEHHIGRPLAAGLSCSRLSPYLAFGSISLPAVVQKTNEALDQMPDPADRRPLEAFRSRLVWHCHFIQRLETEPEIAHTSIQPAFDQLERETADEPYERWLHGETGIPMIDACMKQLWKTGWLPFRMRAMLVSFVTHTLFYDWRRPAEDLARLFLDYEPGIHFSQVQMQAGTTGFNTIRIYNPVKQGRDQDPDGHFVKRLLPALNNVPVSYIHEPWKDPHFFHRNYPGPVVDIQQANRRARKLLWDVKEAHAASRETKDAMAKHASLRKAPPENKKPSSEQLQLFDPEKME